MPSTAILKWSSITISSCSLQLPGTIRWPGSSGTRSCSDTPCQCSVHGLQRLKPGAKADLAPYWFTWILCYSERKFTNRATLFGNGVFEDCTTSLCWVSPVPMQDKRRVHTEAPKYVMNFSQCLGHTCLATPHLCCHSLDIRSEPCSFSLPTTLHDPAVSWIWRVAA